MGEAMRMVHLRTVPDAWHARVIAARLGCEGIITHLQGNLSGPYPFGSVRVLVEADQAELAAELLLADEVEAAFVPLPAGTPLAAGGVGIAEEGPDDPNVGVPALTASHPCGADEGSNAAHAAKTVRLRRAAAALIALVLAGAGALAHFAG
jgi:hypothetical protein